MTLRLLLRLIRHWLPPQTWLETYAVIIAMLVTLLGLAAISALLKGTLP